MWTTVTETFLFLCSFVVICPFVRAPLPKRDKRSSVAAIETVLDRVNTALLEHTAFKGHHAQHAERDTCCVEKCGMYERMNAGVRKLQATSNWLTLQQMSFGQEKLETTQNAKLRAWSSHCY